MRNSSLPDRPAAAPAVAPGPAPRRPVTSPRRGAPARCCPERRAPARLLALGLGLSLLLAAGFSADAPARAAARAGAAPAATARPHPPDLAIYRAAEISAMDMARLDRDKTFVLLAFGGIEPNGPHLPVGASGLVAEALTQATARRLRELKPDFSVLIVPPVAYSTAPAVEWGGVHLHPTALYMGSDDFRNLLYGTLLRFGEGVWRNVAFISYDYSPEFHRRLDEAARYFTDGYGLKMMNASGQVLADSAFNAGVGALLVRLKMDTTQVNPRTDIHGGTALTSLLLAQRPDLVDLDYTKLAAVPLKTPGDLVTVAARSGWLTYVGAPALATPAYGKALMAALADAQARLIVDVAAGTRPALGETPAARFATEPDLRNAVWGMNGWEKKKRQPYDLFLKAHNVQPITPDKPGEPAPAPVPAPGTPEGPH